MAKSSETRCALKAGKKRRKSFCFVCDASFASGENSLIVDCCSHRLPTSCDLPRDKIEQWVAERSRRNPSCDKSIACRPDNDDEFLLCTSCLELITEIDRLESALDKNFTVFWELFEKPRGVLLKRSRKSRTYEAVPREALTSAPRTSPVTSQTRESSEESPPRELLGIAMQEIFDPVPAGDSLDLAVGKIDSFEVLPTCGEATDVRTSPVESQTPVAECVAQASRSRPLRSCRSTHGNLPEKSNSRRKAKEPQVGRAIPGDGVFPVPRFPPDVSLEQVVVYAVKSEPLPDPDETKPSADGVEHKICEVCGRGFLTESKLRRHVLAVHEREKAFNCDICAEAFTTEKQLQKHRHLSHAPEYPLAPFKCSVCNETFETAKKLQVHKRCHDGVICPFCGKFFRQDRLNANAVKDHIAAIHKGEKNYRCELCGEKFGYQRNLAKHRRQSHGINKDKVPTHECTICNKILWERGAYIQHVFYVHGTIVDASRMTRCEYCNKEFVRGWRFNRHVAAHRNEKPHACPDCNYRTPDFTKLRLHMKDAHKRNVRRVFPEGFEKLPTNYTLVDVSDAAKTEIDDGEDGKMVEESQGYPEV